MPRISRLRRKFFFNDARLPAVVWRQARQPDMGAHSHEFLEIVIVLSGHGIHSTGNSRRAVGPGDILVINSKRSHAYENTRHLSLVNILVREEVVHEAAKELGCLPGYHALFTLEPVRWERQGDFASHLHVDATDMEQINHWIGQIEAETRRTAEGGYLLSKSWLLLLIGLLARRYGRQSGDSSAPMEMRLGRTLSWIQQHLDERMTVEILARQAGMSKRTFQRRFLEATGLAPMDYVIRARVRHAATLLQSPTHRSSITDIAFRSGFQDSNYFTRQFRRCLGSSPRAYRQRALASS